MAEIMTMDNDRISTSFGRYLQAIRIEKGLSLDTVSKETRIRLESLLQIEEEDFKKLPDEVFVKGFLRAYAKAVGADGGEAIRLYESRLVVTKKIAESEADLKRSSKKFWPRLLLALTTLFCLMVLSIMAIPYLQVSSTPVSPPKKEIEKKEAIDTREVAAPAPATKPESKPESEPKPEPKPEPESEPESTKEPVKKTPEKYLLRIETSEETWMKIIIDDQTPSEYSLYPGDHIELEATTGYNILIGNAGGVKLSLNNKPVEVSGKSGQVINVQLP
jgi:cytoskeletal protein RodZ